MNKVFRRLLSIFIFNRKKRHTFVNHWGKTKNHGNNNHIIYILPDGTEKEVSPSSIVDGLSLCFEGDNNKVLLHPPVCFEECELILSEGCIAEFQTTQYKIEKATFHLTGGKRGRLLIGKDFSVFPGLKIVGFDEDDLTVKIGEECLFSVGIFIRPSDGHSLLDNVTKDVINSGKDIIIGNHVWCGMNVSILKGGKVADDCVIGAASVVTKAFSNPHCILVGVPAREIAKNITWDRKRIPEYLACHKQKPRA